MITWAFWKLVDKALGEHGAPLLIFPGGLAPILDFVIAVLLWRWILG